MAFILHSLHKIPILQSYWNLTGIKTGLRWYGPTPIDWRWFRSKIWAYEEIWHSKYRDTYTYLIHVSHKSGTHFNHFTFALFESLFTFLWVKKLSPTYRLRAETV